MKKARYPAKKKASRRRTPLQQQKSRSAKYRSYGHKR